MQGWDAFKQHNQNIGNAKDLHFRSYLKSPPHPTSSLHVCVVYLCGLWLPRLRWWCVLLRDPTGLHDFSNDVLLACSDLTISTASWRSLRGLEFRKALTSMSSSAAAASGVSGVCEREVSLYSLSATVAGHFLRNWMSSAWSRASHSTPLAEISLSPGLILPSDMAGSFT